MSLIFNGSTDYAFGRFAAPLVNTGAAFTIYVMFKTPATLANDVICMTSVSTTGAIGTNSGYTLELRSSGALRVTSHTSGGTASSPDLGMLLPNTTYRTVLTKTSGSPNITLRLTNITSLVNSTTLAESNSTLQGLVLGKSAGSNSSYFEGQIEDLAMWRSVLSNEDINTLFNTARRPSDVSVTPDDYWPLVSSDDAPTAGTYDMVRVGPAVASTTLVTTASTAPKTKVLGSSDLTPYNLSQNLGSSGEHVLPAFTAAANADIYRLGIDVTSFFSTNAIRLSLRNAAGDLLTTGVIGKAGNGSITVEVPMVSITAGLQYYITVSYSGGLQITAPCYSGGYVVLRETTSTYDAPLGNFTIAGRMNGSNFNIPHVWAEGSSAASDTTPDVLVFTPATNVQKNTVTTSPAVVITGVTDGIDLPISIANGEYSINGGVWRTAAYITKLTDTVAVRRSSSTSYNTPVTTTVTISGVDSTFTITTRVADTAPTQFTFTDDATAQPSEVMTSNAITVLGIDGDTTAPISVTNGTYSINGGAYTATPGTVALNDSVTVRGIASASLSGTSNVVLDIGGVTDTYAITTVANNDPAINAVSSSTIVDEVTGYTVTTFNLPSASSITIDGRVVPGFSGSSNSYGFNGFTLSNGSTHPRYGAGRVFTIGGVNTTVTVSPKVTQGYVTLTSVNSSAPFIGSHVATAIGDQIVFDLPATLGTATNTVDVDGRIVSSFGSTQSYWHISASTGLVTQINIVAPDSIPTTPVFTAQTGLPIVTVVESNTVTIAGATANQPLDISVVNGEYSINGGAYTATAGTIVNGNTVKVRRTTPAVYTNVSTVTLSISGVDSVFSLTTLTPDITIDPLGLVDATNVSINTVIESNTVTIAGVTSGYDIGISVSGGEYSINGGAYTAVDGIIHLGDQLKLRGTSSIYFGVANVVNVTIGDTTTVFTYTTRTAPSVTLGSDYITIGGGTNTLTAAGLPDADTLTIGGYTVTTLAGSGTSYTFTIPAIADGILYPLFGTRLLTLTEGAIFANVYVGLLPASTRHYVTLTSVNTNPGHLGNYLTCAIGDQVVFDKPATLGVATNSVGEDGRITTDYANAQTMYHIRASDGLVTSINLSNGVTVVTINLTTCFVQTESPVFDCNHYNADRP